MKIGSVKCRKAEVYFEHTSIDGEWHGRLNQANVVDTHHRPCLFSPKAQGANSSISETPCRARTKIRKHGIDPKRRLCWIDAFSRRTESRVYGADLPRVSEKLRNRPNRAEPRAVKHRLKTYPWLKTPRNESKRKLQGTTRCLLNNLPLQMRAGIECSHAQW